MRGSVSLPTWLGALWLFLMELHIGVLLQHPLVRDAAVSNHREEQGLFDHPEKEDFSSYYFNAELATLC